MRLAITLLLIPVFIVTCVIGVAYTFQHKLMYFPDAVRHAPDSLGLQNVQEITLETPDGEKLIAWYAPAQSGKPTLLYFHGNGASLAGRVDRIKLYQQSGLGIFILSYRGYSGSTGNPSEQALVADAQLSYNWLTEHGKIKAENIVLYGESLGTGIAVQTGAKNKAQAMVLETPYTSTVDVGAEAYPYLPVRLLMKDRFESINHIAHINMPLLVLHGTADTVIPVAFGKKLFDTAKDPKTLKIYSDGHHSDLYNHGAWTDILQFLIKN